MMIQQYSCLLSLLATSTVCTAAVGPASLSVNLAFPPPSLSTTVGAPLTISSDTATQWSLAPGSVGLLIATDPTHVTYMPPNHIAVQHSVAGCMVAPNDSVYNTRIDGLPINVNSGSWIRQSLFIGQVGISILPSWGINIVDDRTSNQWFRFHYSTYKNKTPFKIPVGLDRLRETGALTTDPNNDHHVVSIDRQTCHIYETYQDGVSGPTWNAASGFDYDHLSYVQPDTSSGGGTTDAAGLPLLPLTAHLSEFQQGSINHALRFSACAQCISKNHAWPAISSTGSGLGAAPMGSRFRLKSSFDISHFSPKAQIVLTALRRYGMILADIGAIGQIEVSQDVQQDSGVVSAIGEIAAARITMAQFDIIDESSLQRITTSSQIKTNTSLQPGTTATLIATIPGSNARIITIPMNTVPVLVGVPEESYSFTAGTSFQLPSWVNGTTVQDVRWQQLSGPGSLSTSGVYTAPSETVGINPVVFSVSSVQDPQAIAYVAGNVIPSGPIHIDVGSNTSYEDETGNIWLPDTLGLTTGAFATINDNYPVNAWAGDPNGRLDETYIYTWGDDIHYGPFVVPNGMYSVTFGLAKGDCSGPLQTNLYNGLVWGPLTLSTQGQSAGVFDFTGATGGMCRAPASKTVQALVTDNTLRVGIHAMSIGASHTLPILNYLRIDPQ